MDERPTLAEHIQISVAAIRVIGGAIDLAVPDVVARELLYFEIYTAARRMDAVTDPDHAAESVATFLDGLVGIYSNIDPYDR